MRQPLSRTLTNTRARACACAAHTPTHVHTHRLTQRFHGEGNLAFKVLLKLPFFPFNRIKQQESMLQAMTKYTLILALALALALTLTPTLGVARGSLRRIPYDPNTKIATAVTIQPVREVRFNANPGPIP